MADDCETTTDAVLDTGALQRLVPLLSHPHREVRTLAFWAVSNVAAGPPDHIQAVLDSNAVSAVLHVAQAAGGAASEPAWLEANWVLLNCVIGGAPDQVELLVDIGCVPLLCGLLTSGSGLVLPAAEALDRVLAQGDAEVTDNGVYAANPWVELLDVDELRTAAAVLPKAKDLLDGYLGTCGLCGTEFQHRTKRSNTCDECRCAVCSDCDCSKFHLEHQAALLDATGSAAVAASARTRTSRAAKRRSKGKHGGKGKGSVPATPVAPTGSSGVGEGAGAGAACAAEEAPVAAVGDTDTASVSVACSEGDECSNNRGTDEHTSDHDGDGPGTTPPSATSTRSKRRTRRQQARRRQARRAKKAASTPAAGAPPMSAIRTDAPDAGSGGSPVSSMTAHTLSTSHTPASQTHTAASSPRLPPVADSPNVKRGTGHGGIASGPALPPQIATGSLAGAPPHAPSLIPTPLLLASATKKASQRQKAAASSSGTSGGGGGGRRHGGWSTTSRKPRQPPTLPSFLQVKSLDIPPTTSASGATVAAAAATAAAAASAAAAEPPACASSVSSDDNAVPPPAPRATVVPSGAGGGPYALPTTTPVYLGSPPAAGAPPMPRELNTAPLHPAMTASVTPTMHLSPQSAAHPYGVHTVHHVHHYYHHHHHLPMSPPLPNAPHAPHLGAPLPQHMPASFPTPVPAAPGTVLPAAQPPPPPSKEAAAAGVPPAVSSPLTLSPPSAGGVLGLGAGQPLSGPLPSAVDAVPWLFSPASATASSDASGADDGLGAALGGDTPATLPSEWPSQ